MNAIVLLFSDDFENADVQFSEHIRNLVSKLGDEEILFTQEVDGKRIVISVSCESVEPQE